MTTNLPVTLLAIANRFGRDSDPTLHALRLRLSAWETGTNRAEFEATWQALVERVLTQAHWLTMLFPAACDEFPDLIKLLTTINHRISYPDERAGIASAHRAAWIKDQSNLANQNGLLFLLLQDLLTTPPDGNPPSSFLSRYYTWLDLLFAYFVAPGLKPLHERIFSILHLQRSHWPGNYCGGYLYQGWEDLGLSGIKPTNARLAGYGIADLLSANDLVLDLGANSGFLALSIGKQVRQVDAIELNPFLVEIGRTAAAHTGVSNVRFVVADIESWQPEYQYDAAFSLANHSTIDGRMSMDFEAYIIKLYQMIKPGGWLFFESHNAFGPGLGGPGDDGDLNEKFDIVERYFELIDFRMHRAFVPAHDVDKLFVKLKRRTACLKDARRTFLLQTARTAY